VYHQNIFSVGFRTKLLICVNASIIPINPNTMATIPMFCTIAGLNAPNPARHALAANVIAPAAQSIGCASAPFGRSFNARTRHAEKHA
jgi:hypothetical protein